MHRRTAVTEPICVKFTAMVKSSSLIFVLFFAFLLRLEVFSWRLIGVIALIVVGVLLMVATETQFVLSGFLLCLSASAMSGLRWGLTQVLLKNKKMGMDNPAATLFWLSPIMAVSLGIISLFTEGWFRVFSTKFFSGGWQTVQTCFFLTVPGVLAFCMVLSEYKLVDCRCCCSTWLNVSLRAASSTARVSSPCRLLVLLRKFARLLWRPGSSVMSWHLWTSPE